MLPLLIAVVLLLDPKVAAKGNALMNFSADRFLLGNWSCEAHLPDGSSGREEVRYSLVLDGQWLYLEYTLTPAAGPATTTHAYETYDPSLKKWVYTSFSSSGSYGASFSDGWQGNTKVYVPPPGEPVQFRVTVLKVSEAEFTEKIEIRSADGSYRETSSLRCRKV
jgi:hypothetical protein